MITEEDGKKIAQASLGWLGTPHINAARVKGKGVDCAKLCMAAVEDAGLMPMGTIQAEGYSNEWHLHQSGEKMLEYFRKYCSPVEDLQPGDFLLYQYGRCISHAAVYIGNDTVCHSLVNHGVILSNINDVMFLDAKGRSRLRGIYRYNGGNTDGPVQRTECSKQGD